MIKFTLDITPKSVQFGNNRVATKSGKAVFFKDKKAASYKKAITLLARPHAPAKPLDGPLRVDMTFVLERPKYLMKKSDPEGLIPHDKRCDRDNIAKGTVDAMQGFWHDDGQICQGEISKWYAEKNGQPRIEVSISRVKQPHNTP